MANLSWFSLCQIPRSRPFLGIPCLGTGVLHGLPLTGHSEFRLASLLLSGSDTAFPASSNVMLSPQAKHGPRSSKPYTIWLQSIFLALSATIFFQAPGSNRSSWHSHVTSQPPSLCPEPSHSLQWPHPAPCTLTWHWFLNSPDLNSTSSITSHRLQSQKCFLSPELLPFFTVPLSVSLSISGQGHVSVNSLFLQHSLAHNEQPINMWLNQYN